MSLESAAHDSTTYRILYEDRESQPYLGSLDYIFLDKVQGIRSDYGLMKKRVTIEYHTKYIKEKGITFYGPLFFKADLPTKTKVEESPINVHIEMLSPGDTRKMRQEELVKRIEQLRKPNSLG